MKDMVQIKYDLALDLYLNKILYIERYILFHVNILIHTQLHLGENLLPFRKYF